MTQEDVAKKAGMPQSTVSRIEGLTHGLPKLSTLQKIADALDAELVVKIQPKDRPQVTMENPYSIRGSADWLHLSILSRR